MPRASLTPHAVIAAAADLADESGFDQVTLSAVARRLDVGPADPEAGLLVESGDRWALVRRSATEPVLRVTVEAADAAAADDLHDEVRAALAGAVAGHMRSQGVVTLTCGTWGNVLRFLPPLSISDELLEEAFDVVAEAFAATA